MLAPLSPPVADAALGSALLRTGFHVEVESSGRTVALRLHGELDMATARDLDSAIVQAMLGDARALALDLSDLTLIDSTGIAVLLAADGRAKDEGRSFSLHHPRRMVRKALHLTGTDRLVTLEPAEASAS